jgi:pyruvyltransferase
MVEFGWSVERVFRGIEKQLKDTYIFKFYNAYHFYLHLFLADFESAYLCIAPLNLYGDMLHFLKDSKNNSKDYSKLVFVCHGHAEIQKRIYSQFPTYCVASDVLLSCMPMKSHITPNGVDPSLFIKKECTGIIKTLGWCGYIVPVKRIDWSYKIAQKVHLPLSLAVSVPFSEINAWYHSIDLLLVTSGAEPYVETGPLPPFEAICSGIPVIGTPVGNFRHVPGPKFSTIEEAAKIIEDLKKNPEKVKQLIKDQYTYVIKHWTYTTLVQSWKSVFEDVIKKNSTRLSVYYSHGPNIGDGMNPLFFNHFLSSPTYREIRWDKGFVRQTETNYCIFGAGSILGVLSQNASHDIICGSGFIKEDMPVQKPNQILSVRGPLTRKKYLDAGIDCPERYGDLGLLLRYIIPKPLTYSKKYKVGFIPHYIDKALPAVQQAKDKGWKIIDILQASTPAKFVEEIHECEIILSSSLHGIILADSYDIPAYHIILSNNVIGGEFKFRDYYGSVGREYFHVSIDELEKCTPYTVKFDFDTYYNYIKTSLSALSTSVVRYTGCEMLQEFYAKKFIEETMEKKYQNLSINHILGTTTINNQIYGLIFPPSMISMISGLSKEKRYEYYFKGLITDSRKWVYDFQTPSSFIQTSTYGRDPSKKYAYDMDYYTNMSLSKFVICPIGGCPWSYRFFEAIMCFAIPIMEKDTTDKYCKDYTYFEVGDTYIYSHDVALKNYTIFLEKNGVPL